MKILITGGCGFIGSNLVRYLLADSEHQVINLDKLTYAGNPQSLADIADSPRYQFFRGDICDRAYVANLFREVKPDAVMHLAAESHVDRSIDGPRDFIETNIVGTFNLLAASLEHWQSMPADQRSRFRFLHVSTDEVYGALGDTGKFSEQTRYDPHSPYAATKASSDHLARAWHTTYGLPVLVTNCSNNYGPYQFPEKLIPLVIIKALGRDPIPVYGQGLNVRDWLYVEDHARALDAVLVSGRVGETYNIGGSNERTNIDIVTEICALLDELRPLSPGSDREPAQYAELIAFVTDRPGHDFRYAIDSTKIQRELGWKPLASPSSGLRKTVAWYVDHPEWWQDILDKKYHLERLGTSHNT